MKLIWHIVKKDLVRMRLPLALWVLLMVAKIGLGVALRAGDGVDFTWFGRIELYVNLCTWLDALMIYILVAVLIHGDALVGTQAGWKTRPISGARLLGAKLLGTLLIFGMLPVLISVPWWLMCGFGAHEIGEAMLESFVWQALFVLPSLALAVLSENFARYFTLTLAVIFVVAVACLFQVAYLSHWTHQSLAVQEARVWVVLALIVAGIIGVVVHQFLTLRTWRSSGLGLASLVLAMTAANAWPWDFVTYSRATDPKLASGVTMSLTDALITRETGDADKRPSHLSVQLEAQGVPAGRVLNAYATRLAWHGADGAWLGTSGWASGGSFGPGLHIPVHQALQLSPEREDEETQRWRAELRARFPSRFSTPSLPKEGEIFFSTHLTIKSELVNQLPNKPKEGILITDLELARPLPLLELPLRAGPRRTREARSVRVVQVEPNKAKGREGDRVASIVETQPANAVMYWGLLFGYDRTFDLGSGAGYWEVNRSQGTLDWLVNMGRGPFIWVEGVQITWSRLQIPAPRGIRGGKWVVLRPDWTDATTLALVGFTDSVQFNRTVKVEQLREPSKPKTEPEETP